MARILTIKRLIVVALGATILALMSVAPAFAHLRQP